VDDETFDSWALHADEALERSGRDAKQATREVTEAMPDLVGAWRPMTRAWASLVWERARNG
jgi:hypothetical protein